VQFGTDGIRGRAADEVTPEVAYRLGVAVASVFPNETIFVGYDTRESSLELSRATLRGLHGAGARAHNLGVIPTPGVAIIAQERGGAGIVISASHNPYYDNGLKVLGRGGSKLSPATEALLQRAFDEASAAPTGEVATHEFVIDTSAHRHYVERLRTLVPASALEGLHVVLDCANGAASAYATDVFAGLGARVTTLHDQPNGRNINEDCGSTHPEELAQIVVALGADLGLAFDGDADRLIAVDATGTLRDGDDLMVLFALDREARGLLQHTLVVTSMSNLGLRRAMAEAHIALVETDVGDRNILVALEERNLNFGGEQSGHLIFRDLAPTGDGMMTGILLAELVTRTGPLDVVANAAWRRLPQRLISIPTADFTDDVVPSAVDEVCRRHQLEPSDLRLVVRPSGTEPVVRVMVEADSSYVVDELCELVAHACASRE
jgi:phosphoglucosamine mutase